MVLHGSPRCQDNHDLNECHRLYDLGKTSSPSNQFNILNFDPKKTSVRSLEDHLKARGIFTGKMLNFLRLNTRHFDRVSIFCDLCRAAHCKQFGFIKVNQTLNLARIVLSLVLNPEKCGRFVHFCTRMSEVYQCN